MYSCNVLCACLFSLYLSPFVCFRVTKREKQDLEYKRTMYKLAKEHEQVCFNLVWVDRWMVELSILYTRLSVYM